MDTHSHHDEMEMNRLDYPFVLLLANSIDTALPISGFLSAWVVRVHHLVRDLTKRNTSHDGARGTSGAGQGRWSGRGRKRRAVVHTIRWAAFRPLSGSQHVEVRNCISFCEESPSPAVDLTCWVVLATQHLALMSSFLEAASYD